MPKPAAPPCSSASDPAAYAACRMIAAAASRSRGQRRCSPSPTLRYAELLTLREFGKSLTDNRHLRGCGRKIRRGGVGEADEILEKTAYCHQVWLCPVCGYCTAHYQARRHAKALTAWTTQGGSVAFLTLTQSHSIEDELDTLWDRLEDGWDAMVRGSGWRADRKSFGLRGYIRVTEVVHHCDNGWNVHFHALLLLDQQLDAQQFCDLRDRLSARFVRDVRAASDRASFEAQDLVPMKPGSECRLADYCAKGATVCRKEDSRTPMAILADLKETGDGVGLWKEFSAAVTRKKRRRYSSSHGIDNLVRTGHDLGPGSDGREAIS